MTSPFGDYLEQIVDYVRSPRLESDLQDFKIVKNYVLDIMKTDKLFRNICQEIEFGSARHDIRLFDDDEYDVLLGLNFAYYNKIVVRNDAYRPGVVHLDFSDTPCDETKVEDLLDSRLFLKRTNLQDWIKDILNAGLQLFGCFVWGNSECYELSYQRKDICHTIKATSKSREFFIDFVPAVKIYYEDADWYAVPKYVPGPKRSDKCTFQLCDYEYEISELNVGGQVYKDAIILLLAMCNRKELFKVRSYHLVSLAINLIKDEDFDPDDELQDVFLDLLSALCDALDEGNLPYFCHTDINLLNNFEEQELVDYESILDKAFTTLSTYTHQMTLSYERCAWHFCDDSEEEDDDDY